MVYTDAPKRRRITDRERFCFHLLRDTQRHTLDQKCPHKVFPHFHVYDFARRRFFVPFLLPSNIHENNENKNCICGAKEISDLFLLFLDEE
jgi:hypothetical protein